MQYFEAVAAMHRLHLLRKIRARSLMADSGLHPGQRRILDYIRQHAGCTQKEAADELDVSPASAAASLKRLEKAGFVVRQPDEKDARRNRLSITPQGEAEMDRSGRQFEQLDREMFAGMTDQEVSDFRRACEKMFDNLADEGCRHLTIWKLAQRAHEEEEEDKRK